MKSRLFSGSPLVEPELCTAGRRVLTRVVRKGNYVYTIKKMDRIVPEDHYLTMLQANLFALREGIDYPGRVPPRAEFRDVLIKSTVIPVGQDGE